MAPNNDRPTVGTVARRSSTPPLVRLRHALLAAAPVRMLTSDEYASAHAIWEAASDQRARICQWLTATVPPLVADVGDRPPSVISVGVGDGAVDATLATALARDGRGLAYVGVEPHGPSLDRFAARLRAPDHPGLTVVPVKATFEEFVADSIAEAADVVCFVHSLYYVGDVGRALDAAIRVLRPGGSVVALIGPREPLNHLAALITDRSDRPQWFAEDVLTALRRRGLPARTHRIEARVDLSAYWRDPRGRGGQLLDFLIQARSADLDTAVADSIRDYLRTIAPPAAPDTLPHPVAAIVVGPILSP